MDYTQDKKELYNLLEFSEVKKDIILDNLIKNKDIFYPSIDVSEEVYKDTGINNWAMKVPHLEGGKKLIQQILYRPVNNEELLTRRQNTYKNYEIDMETLRDYEDDVLWVYTLNEDIKQNNLIHVLFPSTFIVSYINYIDSLLNFYHIYKIFINPLSMFIYPIISVFAPLYYLRKFLKFNISFGMYLSILYKIFKMVFTFSGDIKVVIMRIVSICFYIFIFSYNVYQTFEYSYMLYGARKTLQDRIHNFNIFMREAKRILEQLPIGITEPFIKVPERSIASIILPNTLTSIYKIWKNNDIKELVSNVLLRIYAIDIITSLSSVKSEFKWCCTNYTNYTKIWGVKNPLLSLKQVSNPVDLSKNIVLTGPNAAGKTTYVKSILTNIILSQSIGIVYAIRANTMIYDSISSFMRISDVLGSKSYFEAEAEYCLQMLNKSKYLSDNNKKGLFLMDEPMHSTPPTEGMATAFAVSEYIGKLPGITLIITTHFHKLTLLEQTYPNEFINLSVEAIEKTEGGFIFPYKIKKGLSYQCIAIELLMSKDFPKSVIDSAVIMKNKICNEISR